MYKIKDIKESELKEYKGKIISVIDKKTIEIPRYGTIGRLPSYMCGEEWCLTCLVEE